VPADPAAAGGYETDIASVLGVSAERASAIAAEYPLAAYPAPVLAFSALVSDANFACPALQVDRWTSARVPTFAYEFDEDNAPQRFAGPAFPPVATHEAELQFLFDEPNAPFPGALTPDQEMLADSMRTAWSNFAANGDPASPALFWPSVDDGDHVMSLVAPAPQLETDFASIHHCGFWAAGVGG
jgi:para-nitrobenzyl esterase